MSRLVVLADAETALGFQLAGVEVLRADDFESARTQLLGLLGDPNVGLIGVSAPFLEKLDEPMRRRIDASYKPVVVSLPSGTPTPGLPSRRELLAALIRHAIGFHITFPGEEQER